MPVTHFTFKCPYCFLEVDDDKVHFRAPYVNDGEFAWPDEGFYENVEDFRQNYAGDEKTKRETLESYTKWAFFAPRDDEEYEKFWGRYGNIHTEDDFFEKVSPGSVPPRKRRVLNPSNPAHWPYLKHVRGDGQTVDDYLWYSDNMVSEISLYDGSRCVQRVCPFCHNPLPDDYGKYETKFIAVVGGVGSGKTVYLSQLLKNMGDNTIKNGLVSHVRAAGTTGFLKAHPVQLKEPLSEPTAPNRFEQPLYYELVEAGGRHRINTIVLYDVSGEVFVNRFRFSMRDYAPFLWNADGVIVLIEPNQLKNISSLSETQEDSTNVITPYELLDSIYKVVSGDVEQQSAQGLANSGRGKITTINPSDTPIAICLSKSDMDSAKEVLGEDENQDNKKAGNDLYRMIQASMDGIKGSDGFYRTLFNARQYNQILDGLTEFFNTHDEAFSHMMYSSYYKYAYFAVTALGCPIERRQNAAGDTVSYPLGPKISPRRIEEPLLWLLYEMGYTNANERIHYPSGRSRCVNVKCRSCNTREYRPPKKNWFLRLLKRIARALMFWKTFPPEPNRICNKCNTKWYEETRLRS